MQHHPLGPSRLGQLSLCPGSWKAQEGLPELDSDAATQSSRVHEWLRDYYQFMSARQSEKPEPLEDTYERLLAERCVEFARSLEGDHEEFQSWESELCLKLPTGAERFGTADLLLVSRGKISLVDWKLYRNPLPEEAVSLQLADLALGVEAEFGVSPRAYAFNPITSERWELKGDLDGWRQEISEILERAWKEQDLRFPSPEACRYCRAVPSCPRAQKELVRLEGLLGEKKLSGAALKKAAYELGAERVFENLDLAKYCGRLADAISQAARRYLIEGHKNSQWEIREVKASYRSISDPWAAFDSLSDKLTEEEYARCLKVDVTLLEGLWREKGLDETALKARLGDLLRQGVSYRLQRKKR